VNPTELLVGLPGEDLIREGLADVAAGRHTIYSRYNALLRELVSFEPALDRRLSAKT